MAVVDQNKIFFVLFYSITGVLTNLTLMSGCKLSNQTSAQLNEVKADQLQGKLTKGDATCPVYVSDKCARFLKAGSNVGVNQASVDFLMKETGGRPIVVIGEWKRKDEASRPIFVIHDIRSP